MDDLTTSLAQNLTISLSPADLQAAFSNDNNDDDDLGRAPPRMGFNTKPKLCQFILSRRNVTASVPLEIRPSGCSTGSGLFIAPGEQDGIEAGREIYRSKPLMLAFDGAGDDGWCHFCGGYFEGYFGGEKGGVRVCSGCGVGRFCSKECQKLAWNRFHKEECKVLKSTPGIKPQSLLAHRLVWFQQKGYITTEQGAVIQGLEAHFDEYTREDGGKTTEVYDVAMAIRDVTGEGREKKIDVGLIWKLVPQLWTNCVRLRGSSSRETVAFALELVTAMINHSCEPNAFAFLEKGEIRVRSLRKIAAGEEITICYIDPTVDVKSRREILMDEHFFECDCARCKDEIETQKRRVAADGETSMATVRQAQISMLDLIKSAAVTACKYPGVYPDFANLTVVESKMNTIMKNAFPNFGWGDDLDPVPMVRLCLSVLYLEQGKPAPALRNGLRGYFARRGGRTGPNAVNILVDIIHVLIAASCLSPDSPVLKDVSFPLRVDISNIMYWYLYKACKEAGEVFGGDCEYTKAIGNLFAKMMAGLPAGASKPPEEDFMEELEGSLRRVVEWAGVWVYEGA
ncbi:hypothetical protein QC764_302260 [Podospora pseudoanserina]|uniref:Suppressor of anucleate metulae protein B n=1 Tax=Podospora pseudoanserina TaxID=2609844 RepID=A0ABR0IBS0_9PEZI|nr:hypothetical protein QC764_302260 [Podospora pseudoanserina]